ncbi:putative Holliday junction resolvase [compost metagenome]
MNGTISAKAEVIDNIILELEKRLNIHVDKWDERLTTVSAYKTMRELNIKQKSKNKVADKLSAIYILEGYLTRIRNKLDNQSY